MGLQSLGDESNPNGEILYALPAVGEKGRNSSFRSSSYRISAMIPMPVCAGGIELWPPGTAISFEFILDEGGMGLQSLGDESNPNGEILYALPAVDPARQGTVPSAQARTESPP
jgi:hypothetical protein